MPIYEHAGLIVGTRRRLGPDHDAASAAFFALERPADGTVPVYEIPGAGKAHRLSLSVPNGLVGKPPEVIFHAFPPDVKLDTTLFEPLLEYTPPGDAAHFYAAGDREPKSGLRWPGKPICQVWRRPSKVALPRD